MCVECVSNTMSIFSFLILLKLAIDFILVAGIIVNLIILLVLFKTKKLQLHHKLFIVILVILFLLLTTSYGIFHEIKWLQYLAVSINGISYLLGPLIYLYVKSLAVDSKRFLKENSYLYPLHNCF